MKNSLRVLVKDIEFPVRVQNVLEELNITTVEELLRRSEEVKTHPHIGRVGLKRIKETLMDYLF